MHIGLVKDRAIAEGLVGTLEPGTSLGWTMRKPCSKAMATSCGRGSFNIAMRSVTISSNPDCFHDRMELSNVMGVW